MKAMTKAELSYQYFPFYVAKYLEDLSISALSMAAEACLVRLFARQWMATTLPLDPKVLQRLTKATPAEWRKIWVELEPLFPVTAAGDGRRNTELHALRIEREAYIASRAENGKNGGRPRKQQRTDREPAYDPPTPHDDSTEKPHGFAMGNRTHNQTESLELGTRVIPLSPPPIGGGSFPTPPERSYGAIAAPRSGIADAVSIIPHDGARAVVGRLLEEQRARPETWASHVRRIIGWTNGLATSGGRQLSWDAIEHGIGDLLDSNAEGRPITPKVLLIFVEDMAKRLATNTGRFSKSSEADVAIAFARAGDPDAIEHCRKLGIDYSTEAVA
jgi:uncharacterized protein YdaU (DUF1376 family)